MTITSLRSFLIVSILIAVVVVAPAVMAQPGAVTITGAGVTLAGLSAPGLSAVRAAPGLMLSPPAQTVQVETDFTLDIVADCGTNADGVEVGLTFDPAYLQVVAVIADQSRFSIVFTKLFDNSAGTVNYVAGSSLECHGENSCPSGVIRLATVTFRAVAVTSPASSVSIYGQVIWSGEPIFNGLGAGSTITIALPPTETPTPTQTATPTNTSLPTPTATKTPTGGATPTTPRERIYLPILRRGR